MRVILFLLTLVASVALLFGLRRLEAERGELLRQRGELSDKAARESEADEHERQRTLVLDRVRDLPGGSLDLAEVRELLIGAERGLDVDRISLDFRPESNLPEGVLGGAINASLVGSFDAVYEYLERVEALRLPLTAGEMSLRAGAEGGVHLTVRYRALWELERSAGHGELAPSDVAQLERWLSGNGQEPPARNPFAAVVDGDEPSSREPGEPLTPAPVQVVAPLAAPGSDLPRLSGYVLARPELEADVNARILAAIRFEGELRLVRVGDSVGPYRVERIAARESVVLVDERTGERVKLYLE